MRLLKNQNKLLKQTRKRKIFLMLDYDGTLSPIVSKPSMAKLSKSRKNILRKLSRKKDILLAIISGRALKDVKNKIGIKGIFYSGNHGFEIFGPKIRAIHSQAKKAQPTIKMIMKELKSKLGNIKGIIIEDKGLTLSIHYRMVSPEKQEKLKKEIIKLLSPFSGKKLIRVTKGKKVFEIRPPFNWNKGKAVLFLLEKAQKSKKKYLPIYAGDDKTDEDAFKAIKSKGITISVGQKRPGAVYIAKDVSEMFKFLTVLLSEK